MATCNMVLITSYEEDDDDDDDDTLYKIMEVLRYVFRFVCVLYIRKNFVYALIKH